MCFYRRKLPHWQPRGAQYFITFRLAGTLPREVIDDSKILRKQTKNTTGPDSLLNQRLLQRKVFQKYERALDGENAGPVWLKKPAIANVIQKALHYRDLKEYDLFAYTIMSNHVHLVFQHLEAKQANDSKKNFPITKIMRGLKRYTAFKSNQILAKKGAFWQPESYDRVIRDQDELERTIHYTLNNPVKAKLVKHWKEWPYTYCKPEFIKTFK